MPAATRDPYHSVLAYQGGPGPVGQQPADYGVGVGASAYGGVSVDGTPSRVAGVLLLAGGVLAALRLAGFRFNVGVTS